KLNFPIRPDDSHHGIACETKRSRIGLKVMLRMLAQPVAQVDAIELFATLFAKFLLSLYQKPFSADQIFIHIPRQNKADVRQHSQSSTTITQVEIPHAQRSELRELRWHTFQERLNWRAVSPALTRKSLEIFRVRQDSVRWYRIHELNQFCDLFRTTILGAVSLPGFEIVRGFRLPICHALLALLALHPLHLLLLRCFVTD